MRPDLTYSSCRTYIRCVRLELTLSVAPRSVLVQQLVVVLTEMSVCGSLPLLSARTSARRP